MKTKNLVAASVFFLFFLIAGNIFAQGDGKVTMEQWLKIINPQNAKKPSPPQATEAKGNRDDLQRPRAVSPQEGQGIEVTVYWHMADDADVYLNGMPLRRYEPSFKTRPDEAPQPAFSAPAIIQDGDIFTVGGRRGGSYGFMLIAVDSSGRILFKTDQQSWKVYEPGEDPDWFNPAVARASKNLPVTIQPDPWYPQKELNSKHGNKAFSIWSTPSERFAYLFGVVGLEEKGQTGGAKPAKNVSEPEKEKPDHQLPDKPAEASSGGPVDPFASQQLQPSSTTPEEKRSTTSSMKSTKIILSDGSSLTMPATSAPVNFSLERKDNSLTSSATGFESTGSMRTVTISSSATIPDNYRLNLAIPAKEYGSINPDTINILRVADMLIDGKVVKDAQMYLPVRQNTNGDLLFSDPYVADSLVAANVAAKSGTSTITTAGIKYGVGTFQTSLNWQRQPALVRMVPETSEHSPGHRSPLSTYTEYGQAKELSKCSQNIVVLVHGHNESEGGGYNALETLEPWLFLPKRDTWTYIYSEYLENNSPDFARIKDCTVFYEYIYPSFRPAFVGNGNLGEDLAQRLASELKPIFDKKIKPNLFIVAHSMGGLVSRSAIQKFSPELHSAFQKLVTWGSPHHGSVISAFRYAFAGPYTDTNYHFNGLLGPLGEAYEIINLSSLLNVPLVKSYMISNQLDTPGARDLRWDNVRPLSLSKYFTISPDATDVNEAIWNLDNGKMLYSDNIKKLNANDYYKTGVPVNSLNKMKYFFLYGSTTKYLKSKTLIGVGSSITWRGLSNPTEVYQGTDLGANDGASPIISMSADGIAGERLNVGDIDHEEYYGAPKDYKVTQEAKAITTAKATFGALQLSDVKYTCTPLVESLSPISGAVGSSLIISGCSFGTPQGTSTITFNGTAASKVFSWSPSQIIATVPEGAATGDVVVTVNGAKSNGLKFTVTQATTLSPNSGPIGTSVTITGIGFGAKQDTSTVTFNGAKAIVSSWSTTRIVTTVPGGAKTGDVIIRINGADSSAGTFTVSQAKEPAVTSIEGSWSTGESALMNQINLSGGKGVWIHGGFREADSAKTNFTYKFELGILNLYGLGIYDFGSHSPYNVTISGSTMTWNSIPDSLSGPKIYTYTWQKK
jgi:hypothetical protein